jgi:hypothetical protein
VFAFYFLYRRLFFKENIDQLYVYLKQAYNKTDSITFIVVICLMFVNWSIETLKWKYLIRKIETVPFFKAFGAVLTGITVSVFTPNRIGEYAGRVFILEKADRWKGVLITVLGSFSQLLVTIVFGSVSLVVFFKIYSVDYFQNIYLFYGISFLIIFLVVLLIFLFFNITLITGLSKRIPKKFGRIKRYFSVYKQYSKKELGLVLLMSVARYFIFITQFYILLNLFDIKMPYYATFFIMSLVYVVMSAIPTITLTELGIRGSVALYFFGLYFDKTGDLSTSIEVGVVSVSTLLWLINIAVPALFGALLVFRLKIFRKD